MFKLQPIVILFLNPKDLFCQSLSVCICTTNIISWDVLEFTSRPSFDMFDIRILESILTPVTWKTILALDKAEDFSTS